MANFLICLTLISLSSSVLPVPDTPAPTTAPPATAQPRADDVTETVEEPPEGYYAFVESPNATPPRVRPPPYRQVSSDCPEATDPKPHVTAHNLCGDLNRGIIPRNPMGQSPNGEPYPFELIRNQTLRFLSRTLPVLRADDTLPRVAHLSHPAAATAATAATTAGAAYKPQGNGLDERVKRSVEPGPTPAHALPAEHRHGGGGGGGGAEARESRKFCDGGGVFCMLYRAINGDSNSASVERREDPGPGPHAHPHAGQGAAHPHTTMPRYEGPPTPCPARVEYATPVFARNYQGVWRYVVQIPYEGYFTQTVEVTRCMQSRCHYLEGGCLSSPRWVSLLVAELHYPQEYQPSQYLQKRSGAAGEPETSDKPAHCDGHDELGCFQVRLYYDWFLVPGSCKCWRPDYFARYVRRKHSNTNEL